MRRKTIVFLICIALLVSGTVSDVIGAEVKTEDTEYYAVIVGVADYQYVSDLSYTDDDAIDMYNTLLSYPNWKPTNIKLLIDSEATKANITAAINWMASMIDSDDIGLFFFSGHGTYSTDIYPYDETDGDDEYICPYDSLLYSYANDIRDDELDSLMTPINGTKIVILDTCFSGGFIKTDKNVTKTKPGVLKKEIKDDFAKDIDKAGFVVLTASDDWQYSYEDSYLENGVFTYYVVEGLSGFPGPADTNADGNISAEETYYYAKPLTVAYTYGDQIPQIYDGVTSDVTLVSIRPVEEHDLAVTALNVSRYAEPGETVAINATITNFGRGPENNVTVELLVNGSVVDSTTIPSLLSLESSIVYFSWSTTTEGTYNISVYVHPVPNETYIANNMKSATIRITYAVKVLFDQTHGTDWIWSYSKWVADMEAAGYIVDELYHEPITASDLAGYDVFIIPQARDDYSSSEISVIQSWVNGDGGLCVIGDNCPSIYTDLTDFAGITWISGRYGGYTSDITPHPVTTGISTAYFGAPISELMVSSPAQDIIRDNYGSVMLAVSEVGAGRVVAIADEQCLDDWDIDEADNRVLGMNIIDWLAGPVGLKKMINLTTDKTEYQPGDVVMLTINITNPTNDTYRVYVELGIIWPTGDGITMFRSEGFYLTPGFSVERTVPMPIPDSFIVPSGSYEYWGELHDYYTDQLIARDTASFDVTRTSMTYAEIADLSSELTDVTYYITPK